MNSLRVAIGNLFESPMGKMSYISYFQYINTGGKLTARSLMETCTIILTYMEDQEKKLQQYEANFKEIETILSKLVDKKVSKETIEVSFAGDKEHVEAIIEKAKERTPEQEATYQKRIVALAKAREARKAKNVV